MGRSMRVTLRTLSIEAWRSNKPLETVCMYIIARSYVVVTANRLGSYGRFVPYMQYAILRKAIGTLNVPLHRSALYTTNTHCSCHLPRS